MGIIMSCLASEAVEQSIQPLENAAEEYLKKYIEEHLQVYIQAHLEEALAKHIGVTAAATVTDTVLLEFDAITAASPRSQSKPISVITLPDQPHSPPVYRKTVYEQYPV